MRNAAFPLTRGSYFQLKSDCRICLASLSPGCPFPAIPVRDRVHAAPGLRVGGARLPVLAQVLVEEAPDGGRDPAPVMDAVGDVDNRHLVDRPARIEALPHGPADLAMLSGHAVDGM